MTTDTDTAFAASDILQASQLADSKSMSAQLVVAYRRELAARAAYLAAPESGAARAAYLRAMRDTDTFRN